MPNKNIDTIPPGHISWVELATTDQPAAKKFYASLFGWQAEDMPIGPDDFYSMFNLDSRRAGAAYTMRADERAMGIPPHWNLYVAVESADKTAAKVESLGGKVIAPPFDVFDAGRMAVIQDPGGAVFCIWEAKKHKGLQISGANTFCWADLRTPDREKVKPFYEGLFGWTFDPGEGKDPKGYWHIVSGGHGVGGLPPASHFDPKTPPHWLIYFYVDDVDAAAAKATAGGAKFYVPPMTMEGVGRMAVFADPQGAVSALFHSHRAQ